MEAIRRQLEHRVSKAASLLAVCAVFACVLLFFGEVSYGAGTLLASTFLFCVWVARALRRYDRQVDEWLVWYVRERREQDRLREASTTRCSDLR